MVLVRFISSFFRLFGGQACRFHPSCSVYAQEALRRRPLASALRLIASRILRCQPFSAGGHDPLPN